jgi:hypothetical protein
MSLGGLGQDMPNRYFMNQNQSDYPHAAFAAHTRAKQMVAVLDSIEQMQRNNTLFHKPFDTPSVLLQAVIIPGEKNTEGQLVESVAFAWFEIVELIQRSPHAIYEIDWASGRRSLQVRTASKASKSSSRPAATTRAATS